MGVRRLVALVLALVTTGSARANAQDAAAGCRAALVSREVAANRIIDPCHELAVLVVAERTERHWVLPRDVQSTSAGAAAPAGSPAQAGAVPTILPTSFAATTLAAVAHDSGTSTIAAISLNPVMFLSSSTNPEEIARLSRLLDVTLFVPVDGLDANEDGRIDYAGARLRINITAGGQSRDLLQRLDTAIRNEMDLASLTEQVFLNSDDPGACADVLMAPDADPAAVKAQCGGPVNLRIDDASYAALRDAARTAREAADAKYLGLDLRLDTGDPSFGTADHPPGTSMLAGIGFGRRIAAGTGGASSGIRGRLGARYVSLRDTTLTDWQVDGGLAIEMSRLIDQQRLEMSIGLEFRMSGNRTSAEVLRTRYAEIRGGITVPIAGTTAVTLSLSAPIYGDVSPTLSVSGNWLQLLGALERP